MIRTKYSSPRAEPEHDITALVVPIKHSPVYRFRLILQSTGPALTSLRPRATRTQMVDANSQYQDQKEEPTLTGENGTAAIAPSRPIRPARSGDEDAAKLEFGAEFDHQKGQPLFTAEVLQLLKLHKEKNQHVQVNNRLLEPSLEHCDRFGQIDTTEAAIAVREQLQKVEPKLHAFEVAQLASLMPKDAEEAKAIIPSLAANYDDDVLNEILKNMDAWL